MNEQEVLELENRVEEQVRVLRARSKGLSWAQVATALKISAPRAKEIAMRALGVGHAEKVTPEKAEEALQYLDGDR